MDRKVNCIIFLFIAFIVRGGLCSGGVEIEDSNVIYNPKLPFLGYINGGVRPQQTYRILAVTKVNVSITEYMEINFQSENTTRRQHDILFQLSIRMRQKLIARNSRENGDWGFELRENPRGPNGHEKDFPLVAGEVFEMIILTRKTQFRVLIDGKHFCRFSYRI